MQKRILGYFDGLATANVHTAKTNKVQSASQTEKTSVSGFYKARKIAVVLMLLVFSVFCAIGSADWIISQQMKIDGSTTSPGETPSQSAFVLDQSALQAHIEIAPGATEATVPSKARANSPSDAASAAPSSYLTTNATATPNAVNAASNASNAPTSAANSASNKTFSVYNGTALTVNLKNQPENAAKKLVDNDSTVQFTTKYITWDGAASLTPHDFISANAATDGMPTNAGKYAIYVQLVGYTGENGARNLGYAIKYHEIAKCPVAITWENTTFTYDGTAKQPTYTSSALCGSDKLALTITQGDTEVTEAKNAGAYTATLSASANYALSNNNTTEFTITQKNVTITWENTTFTYNGKAQIPTATATGLLNGDTLSVSGAQTDAGTYTAIATASENYAITNPEQPFTINRYELIIEWSNTELTYNGEEQNPTATITNPISGITMPEIYLSSSVKNAGSYKADASVRDSNYTIKQDCKFTSFKIKQLNVTLNTLIQKDYAQGGVLFDSSLITFDNALANREITLTSATAKNNISGEKSETAGLFSYTYKKTATTDVYIKEGSTYLISDLKFEKINGLNSQIDNYIINSGSIYLKYKTAKVGNTYYTIEDALPQSEDTLPQSGDIVFESDSSSSKNDSYVITAFSKVGFYNGGSYSFSTSRNIIVPHAAGKTASETETTTWSNENVGSVLIIPEGVSLTMNSSTLDILATVVHRGTNDVCSTGIHGVVMNQGTLTVSGAINNGNTPNIRAYGYLKGNGNVNVESNATVEDLFHIYDFKGGKNTYQLHNDAENYLPISAYSIHNISCNIKVNSDCVYNAFYKLEMGNKWFSGLIPIVGQSNAKSALFKLSNGYIEKKAIPAKSDKTNINALNTITGSNQIKGQKEDVRITGTAVDGAISISASIKILISIDVTMKTGPSTPLPIPYMDIRVCDGGNLSLGNSSYKFMPGSSLMVDEGGTLSLSSGSNLVLYSTEECSQYEKPEGATSYTYDFMTKYCVDKINSYFEVNSSSVIINGGVSGKIVSTTEQVQLNLKNASSTIKTIKSFTAGELSGASQRDVTMYATGDIITGLNAHGENNFSTGTYYSKQMADGSFVWFKNTANITYVLNGGTLDGYTSNVNVTKDGYTLPTPTKDYHEFEGWYANADFSGSAVTEIYSDCTVYAKWTELKYTVNFIFEDGFGSRDSVTLLGSKLSTITLENLADVIKDEKTYIFDGWFLTDNTKIDKIIWTYDRNDGTTDNIINIYAKFSLASTTSYNINLVMNLDEATDEDKTKISAILVAQEEQRNPQNFNLYYTALEALKTDTTFKYVFVGWYTDINGELVNSDFSNIEPDENNTYTLYAKWESKQKLTITNDSTHVIELNVNNKKLSLEATQTYTHYFQNGENVAMAPTVTKITGGNGADTLIEHYYKLNGNDFENSYIVNQTENLTFSCVEETYYKVTISATRGSSGTDPDSVPCTIKILNKNGSESFNYYTDGNIEQNNSTSPISVTSSEYEKTTTSVYYLSKGNYKYSYTKNASETPETTIEVSSITTISKSSDGGTCLVEGTLITLADGTQKKVEDITENDTLLVFNHYTGKYDYAKVLFNDHVTQSAQNYRIINLYFSNNKVVRVVYEHGFFDLDENKYVYITEDNYRDYIGHRFYSATWNGTTYTDNIVTLNKATITEEYVKVYSPVTEYHMNYFTEDMLSMPGGIEGIFNIFEYGEGLKFDEELMQKDIEQFGEFTYEDFKDLVPESIFNSFQTRYFTVAIGKGNLTMDRIKYYIDRYGPLMT